MPVKAASLVPVMKILERSDPTGSSKVWIRPVSHREDMSRGEFLKDRSFAYDDAYGIVSKVGVNLPVLHTEEIWLTYENADIEIVEQGETGETSTKPFEPRSEMQRADFLAILEKFPCGVVREWHEKLLEVNPDWRLPF